MRRVFLVALGFVACAAVGTDPTAPPRDDLAEHHDRQVPLALVHANVLTMEGGPTIERDQTVVIRDGRIVSVSPTVTNDPPDDAHVVDLRGRYIVPGLADMHVHLRREHVRAFLRSGITIVRDLWGHDETLALRDEARTGGLVPWVVTTGPGIDGSPPIRSTPALLERPEDAARLVAELMDQNWDALKVYQNLRQDSFLALFDAANAAGVNLVGHDELDQLMAAGLSSYHALASATTNPGRFLQLQGEVGVVKAGGRADLLVLESNPLENLRSMRAPAAVILRGRFLVPDSIAN